MTQVAEFKVAHLYPPYQGKGLAAIVAEDGTKYKCQQSQLASFQVGEAVAIHYTDESFTSKKTGEEVSFKKLVSKIAKTNGAQPANKQFTRPRMDPIDSIEARKTAAFVAYVEAGKIPLNRDAIRTALDEIDAGCRTHGTNAQVDDEMSDRIPY